jgi:hypothetical protein
MNWMNLVPQTSFWSPLTVSSPFPIKICAPQAIVDQKNEHVEIHLQEQHEKLKAAKAELKKLTSSEVGWSLRRWIRDLNYTNSHL